jgi:phosphohistidine phosphatase
MDLYLFRHGEAEPRAPGIADATRALTPSGAKDVRRVAAFARKANIAPTLILTSKLVRAQQTASIVAKQFGADVRETPALLPNAKPDLLWSEIKAMDSSSQLILVGHTPQLIRFAAFLLGGVIEIDLKKGALLRISVQARRPPLRGALKWLITPGLVRR